MTLPPLSECHPDWFPIGWVSCLNILFGITNLDIRDDAKDAARHRNEKDYPVLFIAMQRWPDKELRQIQIAKRWPIEKLRQP